MKIKEIVAYLQTLDPEMEASFRLLKGQHQERPLLDAMAFVLIFGLVTFHGALAMEYLGIGAWLFSN